MELVEEPRGRNTEENEECREHPDVDREARRSAVEVEVHRVEEDEPGGREEGNAVGEPVPRTQSPQPGLEQRVQHPAEKARWQTHERDERHRARDGDVADDVAVLRMHTGKGRPGHEAADAHDGAAQEATDHDAGDRAGQRRRPHVPGHRDQS